MFDIGFGEMMLLAAIALIAIGPKQLPDVARTVGRMLNELRRATGDLTKTFVDAKNSVEQASNEVISATNSVATSANESLQATITKTTAPPRFDKQAEDQLSFAISDGGKKEDA